MVDIVNIAEFLSKNKPDDLISDALDNGAVEGEIVQLNTFDQLGKFENSEGKKLADIGGEYSVRTQIEKGLGAREVNLNDSGEYWESFQVNPDTQELESNPFKDGENLEDRYGDKLEGLNKQNTKVANEVIENKIWNNAEKSF